MLLLTTAKNRNRIESRDWPRSKHLKMLSDIHWEYFQLTINKMVKKNNVKTETWLKESLIIETKTEEDFLNP